MADSASVGSDLLARLPRAVAGVPEIRWEAVHIAGQGSELHASESATVLRGAYEGKAVAVKDLPLDADPSCDAEKLAHEFLREAAVHASCNAQPTVVKLVGYALQRDVVHGLTMLRLVMPLGLGPLADHVNHDRLDLSQRLDWALQVALGTMGLHKRGVNHQGLKLTNIILFGEDSAAAPTSVASDSESPAGSPAADPSTLMLRLSDIGHAAVRAKNDLPGPSDDCLDFTAPELLEGESATPAADVWSLGLVIYAILARSSNPWAGLKTAGSDFSLFMARSVDVKGVRPDLGKLDPGLAAAGLLEPVAALLQRCWQMDPRARSTAPDVARALKDVARSLTRANTSNTTTTATAGAVGGAGASQQQPSNTSADCADPTSNTSSIAAPATASGTAPLAAAAAAAFNNAKPAAAAPTAGAVIPTAAYAPIAPSPQALAYAQVQCFAPLPTFSAGAAFSYPATHWAAAPTQGAAVGGAGAGGGAGGAGPSLHPTGLPTYEIDGSLGAGLGSASASHAWTAISLAALMLGTVGGPQAAAGQGFADPMSPDPAPGCLSPAASEATFASEKLTTTALLADPDLIDKVTVPQVIAPTVLVTAPLAAVVGAGALPSLAMTASVSSPAQTLTSSPAPSAAAFAAAFAGAGVGNIFNASELERPTDRTTIAQVVDVAFVMDCTASMTPHIEKCKTKLVEIAEGIVAKLPGTSIKCESAKLHR